ncbi:hypothetical protein V502_03221 [Pseudogymnoascus sp. VKM F-4520 (FW-2644)]|nr:hypothetical protein V502_03221 [Pseudogymnoascus sp. VKM F-4520 (FW-2644)]
MSGSNRNMIVGDGLALTLPQDQRPWYKVPHLLKLNAIILSLLMYSGTVGYDGSMMNGLQSLGQWHVFMDYPKGAWLGFINSAASIGALLFIPLQAYTADRYGRRPCLFIGLLFIALGTGIQTGAKTRGMFVAGRFFVGVATTWFMTAAILITEIAYPSHRSKVTALYNCQFYVGSLISAWVTFGVRNLENSWAWRVPSLLQLAIPVVAFAGTLACPESPRWLISKGRNEEARAMLATYHASGDANAALVIFELAEIESFIALERQSKHSTSYLDMFRTKGNRHRLFISVTLGIFSQWSGNGVVSYYLSLILRTVGITSVTQQTLLNGFLNLWNLIMAVCAALMVDKVGRRKLFLTSTSIMLVSYIIITALSATFAKSGVKSVGSAVIPFLFIFFAGYDIAFTPLPVSYTAEIWTFALRARGTAVLSSSINIALLFNVFVNPIALGTIQWKYYITFICVLIICLFTVYFAYPETRGHTLEEMAVVFDGKDASILSSEEVLGKVEHSETVKRNVVSHIEGPFQEKA